MDPSFLPLFIDEEIYLIENQKSTDKHYLGSNGQGILILTTNDTEALLSTAENEFLQKVLKSVQLSYDDVTVFNVAYATFDPSSYQKVLSLGVQTEQLSAKYAVTKINGTPWLMVDSLTDLQQDRSKKLLLWQHLQVLFPEQTN